MPRLKLIWCGLLQVSVCSALWLPACSVAEDSRTQRDIETLRRHYRMTQPERRDGAGLDVQVRTRENWRRLRVGMTEAEVESLLGRPDRIDILESEVRWHYDREHDKGWVGFTGDSRAVLEWRYF